MSEPLMKRKRCQQGYQIEHICTDPSCPGDQNRRKLEMFGAMKTLIKRAMDPEGEPMLAVDAQLLLSKIAKEIPE